MFTGAIKYTPLQLAEDKDQETGNLTRPRRRIDKWVVLCVVSWVVTLTVLVLQTYPGRWTVGDSYEGGWTTDFGTTFLHSRASTLLTLTAENARSAISIEKKTFTGSLAIRDDGSLYVPVQDPVWHVGDPSPELDSAWASLIGGA